MSYNCDTFKVKKLENLKIPVESLYKHRRSDWYPDRIDKNGSVSFEICSATMDGYIENHNIFVCEKIDFSGEGSGTAIRMILEPALKDSMGELIVSCVWEGGDTINKLTVKDGKVSWEDIDI